MSVQRLNSRSSHPRGNHCGPNQSCPSPTIIACRICDKIFVNHLALIDHYDRHHIDHLRISHPSNRLDRRGNSFTNNQYRASSLALQQKRHHPYLPNGYRPLRSWVHHRIPVAATTTSHFLHPRNANPNSSLNATSLNLPTINGNYVANNQQPESHHYMHIYDVSQRLNSMIASHIVQSQQAQEQKRFGESAESATVWYLSHLEQPISKTSPEKKHEPVNLDLTLKL